MTKTMTAREAKNNFGKLIDLAQREPVIITKHDRPVARVVPYDDGLGRLDRDMLARTAPRPRTGPVDMRSFVGSVKGYFRSPEEIDVFIREGRDDDR
jgi:prevent-host-death family protein